MSVLAFGEWWNALAGTEKVFWAIAIIFGILFFIQFVLSLIGLDLDMDTDTDIDGDTDGLNGDFTIFSIRSIIAFFTFFGWTGVGVLNSGGGAVIAIIAGVVAGVASMFVVGYVMYMFSKLQDSGSVTKLETAINKVGEVYMPIPAWQSGRGKVQVVVSGTLQEIEAVTEGRALSTGTKVRVIEVIDNAILLVEAEEDIDPILQV